MALGLTHFIPSAMLALALFTGQGSAETLQIYRGDPAQAVSLAPGATVVLASPTSFVEFAVASPGVAGVSTLGQGDFELTGNSEGRTTLTVFHDDDVHSVAQVDILVTPNADSIILPDSGASVLTQPIPLPPTPKPQVIQVMGGVAMQHILLTAHQAIVLETDIPFTKIVAADTAVAAGAVLWDGKGAYIIGKSAGSTTMTLSREGAADPTHMAIVVTAAD